MLSDRQILGMRDLIRDDVMEYIRRLQQQEKKAEARVEELEAVLRTISVDFCCNNQGMFCVDKRCFRCVTGRRVCEVLYK